MESVPRFSAGGNAFTPDPLASHQQDPPEKEAVSIDQLRIVKDDESIKKPKIILLPTPFAQMRGLTGFWCP